MPSIDITDTTAVTVNATLSDNSLLGKTPNSVLKFLHDKVVTCLSLPLDQAPLDAASLGFSYTPELSFEGGSATFTAGAGAGGKIDLHKPSTSLFDQDQFGVKIDTGDSYYLALCFNVNASATPAGTAGAFTLTLAISAQAIAALYLPFAKDAHGAFPTLKSSLQTLLSSYKLPTEIKDLTPWPVGTVFTFDCQGSVGFSGSLNMLAAVNPTASASFSDTAGPICVTAGPTATLTGGFTLSGEFEVRLWKRGDNLFQLGYYKKTGKTLTVSFDGSLGADATVDSFDLVGKLYGLLGDKAKLDPAWIKANLPSDQADQVKAIFKTAVAKKLSIEVNAECDTTLTNQVAFSWNFDLSTAGGVAQQALTGALRGEVDPLLKGDPLPAGITAAGSVLDRIRDTKRTFSLNFLGLFDHASVTEAALDLHTAFDENGQLILTDTAHVKRLAIDTNMVSATKLREVLAEDGTATISYAAMVGTIVPQLTVMYGYFKYLANASPADLQSFLTITQAVTGKDPNPPWIALAAAKRRSQSAYLEVTLKYDGTTAPALFFNAGNLRDPDDYAAAVRNAILAMPFEPAFDPHFLEAVRDNNLWRQLITAGDLAAMYPLLGVDQMDPPAWAVLATSWIRQASLWRSPMHNAGQAMQAVTAYLQQHPGDDLKNDHQFQQLRTNFANRLKSALGQAPVFPDDASGLLILYSAAPPANVAVTVSYAGKTVSYP